MAEYGYDFDNVKPLAGATPRKDAAKRLTKILDPLTMAEQDLQAAAQGGPEVSVPLSSVPPDTPVPPQPGEQPAPGPPPLMGGYVTPTSTVPVPPQPGEQPAPGAPPMEGDWTTYMSMPESGIGVIPDTVEKAKPDTSLAAGATKGLNFHKGNPFKF